VTRTNGLTSATATLIHIKEDPQMRARRRNLVQSREDIEDID
jgi:hypothetical protein